MLPAFFLAIICALSLASSHCLKPSVRKEWRALSTLEKADWIAAVNCLSKLPHTDALAPIVNPDENVPVNTSSSFYDDIVYVHMDLSRLIHFTGLFLPWHRYYLQMYENELRSKCGFKGSSPYWDWSLDSSDVYNSPIFQESDPTSGLGGWGDPSDDYQVADGGFSSLELSYPSYHFVRRNFTLQPFLTVPNPEFYHDLFAYANASFTPTEVNKMVNGFVGDFKGFQIYLEAFGGAHGSAHLIVGGDLAAACPASADPSCISGLPTFAPNEPMFWLHHGMVDKVWYDWQNAHPANAGKFSGGSVQRLSTPAEYNKYPTGSPPWLNLRSTLVGLGLWDDALIKDVINTKKGILCYEYA